MVNELSKHGHEVRPQAAREWVGNHRVPYRGLDYLPALSLILQVPVEAFFDRINPGDVVRPLETEWGKYGSATTNPERERSSKDHSSYDGEDPRQASNSK